MEKELRSAIKLVMCIEVASKEFGLTEEESKALQTLLNFTQSYLDLQGWSNEALHLCKLASLKDKVEVMSEESFWFEESVERYGEKNLWLCFKNGIINLNHIANTTAGIIGMQLNKAIASALSGKISKPKKIGREEIRGLISEYTGFDSVKDKLTDAILKLLDKEE